MKLTGMDIAVLAGGWSGERPFNLRAGGSVLATLREHGVHARAYEVSPNSHPLQELLAHPPDFALLCVTEEVPIQGALQMLGVPFNGSGPLASAMSLDKVITREALAAAGVRTPRYSLFRDVAAAPDPALVHARRSEAELTYPLIVKPRAAGCSLGVELVDSDEHAAAAILGAAAHSSDVLLEEFVRGSEVTLGVVGETMLEPIVIGVHGDLYRAADKWRHASADAAASYQRLSAEGAFRRELAELTERVRQAVSIQNAWRLDAIMSAEGLSVLEVNTLPKLAAPYGEMAWAAASSGVSHYELLSMIVQDGLSQAHTHDQAVAQT